MQKRKYLKQNETYINLKIDKGMRDRFKILCIKTGQNMSDRICELIENDLKDNEKREVE